MIDLRPRLDAPEVRALLALSVYPGRLEKAVAAYRHDPARVLLGLDAGSALLGCIGLDAQTVLHLGVRADRRGQGLGRALIEGAVRQLGLERLEAETDGSAVGFYRRCGFRVTSLGEPYPGVERFHCVWTAGPP